MNSSIGGLPPIKLTSLSTSVPPYMLHQGAVADLAGELFCPGAKVDRFAPVYRNAGIRTRQSSVPIEWYLEDHDAAERSDLYLASAVDLLYMAASKALVEAGLRASEIDAIVTVSSTGMATPSLDARLMGVMDFRPDVMRLPIVGLGCAGGVLGLARATSLAQAIPGSRILLLVVELCGLTFRPGDRSKSNRIATALFGDGAAAAIVSSRGEGLVLGPSGEHLWPGTLDVMGWDVVADGLKVVFSRDIPTLILEKARPATEEFLGRQGLSLGDVDGFVCHPGGAKVIDALEDVFDVQRGGLVHARQVLEDHGNMSAPTVLFVLRAAMDAEARGRHLMLALGPGFTLGFQLIDLG